VNMNECLANENDSTSSNRDVDLEPRVGKSDSDLDEEASNTDTIANSTSFSSFWVYGDGSRTVMYLDEVNAVDKDEKHIAMNPNSENDDLKKKGRRAFSLEMMCCLTLVVVLGVGVRIMWRQYADP
jgi:hypothetical protein